MTSERSTNDPFPASTQRYNYGGCRLAIGCWDDEDDFYLETLRVASAKEESNKKKVLRNSLEELSKDLGRAIDPESSRFADVILKCGGASISAHKIILSVRSPVFAAMFASPMKESLENEVNIDDIELSVLLALLKYIYTGKTPDLNVSLATDLLFAADKYQLQDLKTVCLYFIEHALSVQNVWKILVLGDMHLADLKSLAVDYIRDNRGKFSAIKNMQEYKDLRKGRPDLAMELLESLVEDI